MTTRADLPPHTWQLISDAPHWIYIMLRTAEGSGLFSRGIIEKIRESTAFTRFFEDYQTSQPLIRDVIAAAIAEEKTDISLDEDRAIDALERVAVVLATFDDAESDAFKHFLLDAAQTIAEASGESFFGSGDRVSDSEVVAVSRIISALSARGLEHPFKQWLKRPED